MNQKNRRQTHYPMTVRACALLILARAQEPLNRAEVQRRISRNTAGEHGVHPSTVETALRGLVDDGCALSESVKIAGHDRDVFTITAEGNHEAAAAVVSMRQWTGA
jgi:DNA-binding PadR family transcriptional regulator